MNTCKKLNNLYLEDSHFPLKCTGLGAKQKLNNLAGKNYVSKKVYLLFQMQIAIIYGKMVLVKQVNKAMGTLSENK